MAQTNRLLLGVEDVVGGCLPMSQILKGLG